MLFYTGTTLAGAMYIVGAVEIGLVSLVDKWTRTDGWMSGRRGFIKIVKPWLGKYFIIPTPTQPTNRTPDGDYY